MSRRVLVVDDNLTNLKLLVYLLQTHRYEVETASDAEGALTKIASFAPAMLLLDIQLPTMDGLTLARRLRADPATRDLLVVAITAHAMKGDQERALAAGCDAFVTKPIDTRTLPGELSRLFEGSVSRRRRL